MDVFMCLVGVILLYVGFVAWVLEGVPNSHRIVLYSAVNTKCCAYSAVRECILTTNLRHDYDKHGYYSTAWRKIPGTNLLCWS